MLAYWRTKLLKRHYLNRLNTGKAVYINLGISEDAVTVVTPSPIDEPSEDVDPGRFTVCFIR